MFGVLIPFTVLLVICFILFIRTRRITGRVKRTHFRDTTEENLAAAEHLSEAVRFQTESFSNTERIDLAEYERFHTFIKETYPRVHGSLERTVVSDFAVLYTWRGRNPGLKPVLLMGHWDVVPVPPEERKAWKEDPYSGKISDGYIWGRGCLDDKISVIALLETVEALLKEDFTPQRTVYLAFGGDEEIGGLNGAARTARYLEGKNIRLSWVLDEASIISSGGVMGIQEPIALIGVAEKGHTDFRITARGMEGHSSMPPRSTAAGVLARAICRIESKPFRPRMLPLLKEFLKGLAPHASLPLRIVLSNLWLTAPLVIRVLAGSPATNSLIRTTCAVTMLKGAPAENVLPDKAQAIINTRILPGDTLEGVKQRLIRIVSDDSVEIEVNQTEDSGEPVPSSGTRNDGFRLISDSLEEVLPGVIPCPFLVTSTSDSRHFKRISDSIFRFIPVILTSSELSMFHGKNERISVRNFSRYIEFLVHVMRKL